jgi:hypothetical protein
MKEGGMLVTCITIIDTIILYIHIKDAYIDTYHASMVTPMKEGGMPPSRPRVEIVGIS